MRGLDLFLKYLLITLTKEAAAQMSLNSSIEKLEKIFTDVKFWKYARDHSLKVLYLQLKERPEESSLEF